MAKLSLNDVSSGYNRSKINQNFTDIESELQNKVLYRDNPDGEPNQMENELDMNSNDIANVNTLSAAIVKINGKAVSVNELSEIPQANEVTYDNTSSGLTATDAQAAIDEIEGRVDTTENRLDNVGDETVDTATGSAQSLSAALDGRVIKAVSVSDLKTNVDPTGFSGGEAARITVFGGGGDVTWVAGDKTSEVDGDPNEVEWIESSTVGKAMGAWRRTFNSLGARVTVREQTYYVDPAGDDNNDGRSASTPFRTIQRAVDEIPEMVLHRQTIKLADGTYSEGSRNTNPIPGASTVRTVRVLVDGKSIAGREMLVIEGNTSDKTAVVIDNNDVYSSVYVEETNGVVVKDLTCDMSTNPGAAISIFQHRRGDMRVSDVTVSGNSFDGSHAFIVETGGFMEFAGDIDVTNMERCFVALEGVMSFIGSSASHTGGGTTAPRTFEVGSEGQIYIFSGTWTVSDVLRVGWNKGGYLLISPSSMSATFTGFGLDCVAGAHIDAANITSTGGALAVNNDGGLVEITTCNFTDQTTNTLLNKNGGKLIVDDCTLTDTTITKSILQSESGEVIITGDGDFTDGFRQIFARNTQLTIGEQVNFGGAPGTCIDARGGNVRMLGTSSNPITFGGYSDNAWYFKSCGVTQTYCTVTNPTSKTACIAIGSQIDNEGGVNIDGGFRGYDLSQNSSLTAETATGSDLTNMSEGINARRGSQVYYRSSSMDFTGTTTPTVDNSGEFSLVTSF